MLLLTNNQMLVKQNLKQKGNMLPYANDYLKHGELPRDYNP